MGMFDLLTSDYPLPHHQHAEFQTKDLAHLVHGEPGECGFLDHYRITEDGRLMLHRHVREWRSDPEMLLGGCLESVRDWWEEVPGIHGDVRIYTRDDKSGGDRADRVEFRVRFTHGRLERIDQVELPRAGVPETT
jgi:hypothetical protein